MKKLFLLIAIFLSVHAAAQNDLNKDNIVIKQSLKLGAINKVDGVSNDTSYSLKRPNKLITERAAKEYADSAAKPRPIGFRFGFLVDSVNNIVDVDTSVMPGGVSSGGNASNGLHIDGTDIKLGGQLVEDTRIYDSTGTAGFIIQNNGGFTDSANYNGGGYLNIGPYSFVNGYAFRNQYGGYGYLGMRSLAYEKSIDFGNSGSAMRIDSFDKIQLHAYHNNVGEDSVLTTDSDGKLKMKLVGGGSGWSTTGNTGTDTVTHFFGTTDNMGFRFKTNNIASGGIDLANFSVSFGQQSLLHNATSGYQNAAFGTNALKTNTTGQSNSAFGNDALIRNTTGSNNTAVGRVALDHNTTGVGNTAIGLGALTANDGGNYNTGIGLGTQTAPFGDYAISLGYTAYATSKEFSVSDSIHQWKSIGMKGFGFDTTNKVLVRDPSTGVIKWMHWPAGDSLPSLQDVTAIDSVTADGITISRLRISAIPAFDNDSIAGATLTTDTNYVYKVGNDVRIYQNCLLEAPIPSSSSQCGFGVPTASVGTSSGSPTNMFRWRDENWIIVQEGSSTTYLKAIDRPSTFYVSEYSPFCESSPTTVSVIFELIPDSLEITYSNYIHIGQPDTLSVAAIGGSNTYTYSWTAVPETGSGMTTGAAGEPQIITPTIPGEYKYVVVAFDSDRGCYENDSVTVIVTKGLLQSTGGSNVGDSLVRLFDTVAVHLDSLHTLRQSINANSISINANTASILTKQDAISFPNTALKFYTGYGTFGSLSDSIVLTRGTTGITSGTTGRVLYDSSGKVGEYGTTGTGSVVMSTSPTIGGNIALSTLGGAITSNNSWFTFESPGSIKIASNHIANPIRLYCANTSVLTATPTLFTISSSKATAPLFEANNNSDFGFYQSGASATNYFNGRTGFGISVPNTSALVDISSTTKGFLPPRQTTAQRTAISTPAAGLVVYDTDLKRICWYDGAWNLTEVTETGTAAPSSTPLAVGDKYIDTTNKKIYFATGTSSSADWTIVN